MAKFEDNNSPHITFVEQGSAPATPGAGKQKIFIDSADHKLKRKDSSGSVTIIGSEQTASFALSGDISPAQITSNQNDYNPTGLSTAAVLRLNSDASRDITGLQGGSDGRIIAIYNTGSQNIVLKDASGSSSAANRFELQADITLAGGDGCLLIYDSTSSLWRCIGKTPGGSAGTPVAVGARVHYAAGTQTAATGAGTALLFDTEVFDTDAFHSTVSNTSRLTVPSGKAGKYMIGGGFHVGNNADIQIRLNGSTIIGFGRAGVGASSIVGYSVDTFYPLAVGDYVELMAVGQGASRTVNQDGIVSPHFWLALIGT